MSSRTVLQLPEGRGCFVLVMVVISLFYWGELIMKVLVTGATGFVGGELFKRLLLDPSYVAFGCVKSLSAAKANIESDYFANLIEMGDLEANTELDSSFFNGAEVVVHCAGVTQVTGGNESESIRKVHVVNVDGTLRLARAAAGSGVKRFVFISSVKVHGEITRDGSSFLADSPFLPIGPYACSKAEAEKGLLEISASTSLEVVIVRPPLVYGPGAKGNSLKLFEWINKGIPLPLGRVLNRRSLVSIDNLVDLIICCLSHPAAVNQAFLVSDGNDLSTTQLLRVAGKAMNRPARLIAVPAKLLQLGAMLLGEQALAQRLLGSLQVDISKTCELLDWKPPYTVEEGLKRCFDFPH